MSSRGARGVWALVAVALMGAGDLAALDAPTAAAAVSRAARDATSVSGNWAGYAITVPGATASTRSFRTVSASWIQPAVKCAAGSRSYSSFWVGLGGYRRASNALEQIGTEGDCGPRGGARYDAWYELVPNAPVTLHVRIHPGDSVTARVTVVGRRVSLALHDATTAATFTRVLRFAAPDTSSAEWIAEAPSGCDDGGNCVSLPLANFNAMTFSGASATAAGGHQGAISDPAWSATQIDLRQDFGARRLGVAATAAAATPTPLGSGGASFTVNWSGVASQPAGQPPPSLFPG